MLYVKSIMRQTILSAVIVALLLGCGYDPEQPVYDTTKNPGEYPPQAVLLIDRIDKGTLLEHDSITYAFADLYTNHPEMLDNKDWLQIISRLGVKFRYHADNLVEQGIANYDQAASLYTLAAFARPSDERLQNRRLLFSAWERARYDSLIPAGFDPETTPIGLDDQLRILRYFMLADSTSRQFAEEFLVPRVLNAPAVESAFETVPGRRQLSTADKCFLTTLGFTYRGPGQPLASFAEPAIDLVASQITAQPGGWYHAELYFIPRESLQVDYTIAFRISNSPVIDSGMTETTRWVPFDFHPAKPATTWKAGEIAPAYRRFAFSGPIGDFAVGLFQTSPDSAHFIRLRDTGEPLLVLPASTVAGR
jgi:hypothetical protein